MSLRAFNQAVQKLVSVKQDGIIGPISRAAMRKHGIYDEYLMATRRDKVTKRSSKGQSSTGQLAVKKLILKHARLNGIKPSTLLAIAHLESGFRSNAKNSITSAAGVFQFMPRYQAAFGLAGSKVWNAELNIKAGIRMYKQNQRFLKRKGYDFPPWLAYMAHQQGAGGAHAIVRYARTGSVSKKVLRNMKANAPRVSRRGNFGKNFLVFWKNKFAKTLRRYT